MTTAGSNNERTPLLEQAAGGKPTVTTPGDGLPLAYCLLSKIRAHGFYDKVI
jgi:hypothetical protein